LVKQVNKLKKSMNKIKIALLLFTIITSVNIALAQEIENISVKEVEIKSDTIAKDSILPQKISGPFIKDSSYELGGMTVIGLRKFEEETVKVYTGLIVGQEIRLPGDKLTSAIKKLYETKQFSNVEVYISKIDGNTAYLEFDVEELPQLNNIKITGVYILLGKYFTDYYTGTFGPLQDNLRIILWKLKKPLGIFRRVLSIVQYMSYKERMKGVRRTPVSNTLCPFKNKVKLI
jgi:hypothetical protein